MSGEENNLLFGGGSFSGNCNLSIMTAGCMSDWLISGDATLMERGLELLMVTLFLGVLLFLW